MKSDVIFVKFHTGLQGTDFVLVPRPLKNSDFEDEHEDDDEKNPNKLHAYALRPQPYTMQIV
jgi:hypothetical protein